MGLTPISFALTGPIAGGLGVKTTMIGAGVLGVVCVLAFLLVPGLRDPEQQGVPVRSFSSETSM
jgi:DHA3 family tetracycline resistance protein-like MFS transporter